MHRGPRYLNLVEDLRTVNWGLYRGEESVYTRFVLILVTDVCPNSKIHLRLKYKIEHYPAS